MLYEPFPGGAAVVLTQLGLIQEGQAEGLGVRRFDAETGRLSLAMEDGRVVELVRATHARLENRYAVLVRTGELSEERGFIQIDRDFGVTDLLNHQTVSPQPAEEEHVFEDDAVKARVLRHEAHEDETTRIHQVRRPAAPVAEAAAPAEDRTDSLTDKVEETNVEEQDTTEPVSVQESAEAEPAAESAGSQVESDAADEAVSFAETEALAESEVLAETEALAQNETFAESEPETAEPAISAADVAAAAQERYYRPLLEAFGPEVAEMFQWIAETGTIQTYEHRATGRYMHIDGASGLFYDQTRTPISQTAALRHVMPAQPVTAVEQAVAVVEEPAVEFVEAPALLATREKVRVADSIPHGDELGLDTFVRKHTDADERIERESWRKRIAGLGRTFRLGKNGAGRSEE